jgi:sialic acid synthase SpsE
MSKLEIVADVGSNHRGRLELALKSVQVAKDCGADVVKYQLYSHIELFGVPGIAEKSMPREWLPQLAKECERVGIEFMCTAFSPEGVAAVDPHVKRHKLASSEFSHTELLRAMLKTDKPVIISTGGIGEFDLEWMKALIQVSYASAIHRISMLECVAAYPAAASAHDVSLMQTSLFDGLSDHTMGSAVACAAVGAGATILEKHLDPFPGAGSTPDSGFALGPTEFRMYVQDVREAASAVGSGIKKRKGQNEYALRWMRRYVVTKPIAQGDVFKYNSNFGIYRSLKDDTRGLSPITMPLERLNGMTARHALEAGESIGPGELA